MNFYNKVWLLNTIFLNKLQFCLVLFRYKLLLFRACCFQLIVQILPFSLVRFLTNNNFHTFEASTRCWVASTIYRYLVDSKNILYFIGYGYIQSILIDYIFLLLLAKPIPFQGCYKLFQNLLVWYRYLEKWFLHLSDQCQG